MTPSLDGCQGHHYVPSPHQLWEELVGLVEPSPQSPSVFLDLPPTPHHDNGVPSSEQQQQQDVALERISRVLMEEEEDMDGVLLSHNHHDLLHTQQSLAQIIASSSSSKGGASDVYKDGNNNATGGAESCSILDLLNMAFVKGREEGCKFLPNDKHRLVTNQHATSRNGDEETTTGRACKLMATVARPEPEEEAKVQELIARMMLDDCEVPTEEMEHLRAAMANEKKNKTKSRSKAEAVVVDLHTLLFNCARAIAMDDHMVAVELLKEIKQHASATGDATQRLAKCFANGLEARLAGTGMLLWNLHMAERPIAMDFLRAYSLFMAACCFHKIALKFSIMTIVDAMVGKSRLHVVDYGMHYGFHWAGLIRWLANRNGGPPEVRITAIDHSQPRIYPDQQIEEQGRLLSKCAKKFGVPFKFHVITKKWEEVFIEDLNKDTDEVLIVNDLFNFGSLMDESVFFDTSNPRDTVLNNIRRMRPYIFIQSIVNRSSGTSFLTRFRELLFYHMALFDMLDATMPRNWESRLVLEQGLFRLCTQNDISCEGVDLVIRPEKYIHWQVRNQRAGLRQRLLKPSIIEVLKDEVKKEYHKDFFLSEDGQWLLQGWMGRVLFAHSTWVAEDAISK